jgi:hypothetical protein
MIIANFKAYFLEKTTVLILFLPFFTFYWTIFFSEHFLLITFFEKHFAYVQFWQNSTYSLLAP